MLPPGLQDGRVGVSLGAIQELHREAKDYPQEWIILERKLTISLYPSIFHKTKGCLYSYINGPFWDKGDVIKMNPKTVFKNVIFWNASCYLT